MSVRIRHDSGRSAWWGHAIAMNRNDREPQPAGPDLQEGVAPVNDPVEPLILDVLAWIGTQQLDRALRVLASKAPLVGQR